MLPFQSNSPYSATVNGIRHGSKYRRVNERKSNVTATDIKKMHQARCKYREYPMKESSSNHHHDHHDHHDHQRHRHHHHHPTTAEQSAIRSVDTIFAQTIPNIRTSSGPRQCSNCCGGLPGRGPGSGLTVTKSKKSVVGQCCCQNETCSSIPQVFSECYGNMNTPDKCSMCPDEKRLRGGGSTTGLSYTKNLLPSSNGSVNQDISSFENFEKNSKTDNANIRIRGGCGGCGFPQSIQFHYGYDSASSNQGPPFPCPLAFKYPRRRSKPCPPLLPVCFTRREICGLEDSRTNAKGCCPCGGCGGAACSDNPGGGQTDAECCSGSHVKGLPCKCKCQSCKDFHPCGGCGGQSCGKIYSCTGSSGGTCCFPRNYKRRAGPECCGGGNSACGGCC